jgi:pimeloyl-ACP methyl ester carboxylesterase
MALPTQKRIWLCMALAAILLASACQPSLPSAAAPTPTPRITLIPLLQQPLATAPAAPSPTIAPSPTKARTARPSPTSANLRDILPETITFVTDDQVTLHGTYYRAGEGSAPLVVLVHQARGDQLDWWKMGYVQYLLNQDAAHLLEGFVPLPAGVHFSVFTFDMRGHGQSEGEYNPEKASQFMEDMRAALETARALPGVNPAQIGAVGSSTGSAVLFRCPGICAGVMSISLYPSETARQTIEKLTAQGTVVYCISEFPCPEVKSEGYVTVTYPGSKHGYELLDPALSPAPGQVFYEFLRQVFGFDS